MIPPQQFAQQPEQTDSYVILLFIGGLMAVAYQVLSGVKHNQNKKYKKMMKELK